MIRPRLWGNLDHRSISSLLILIAAIPSVIFSEVAALKTNKPIDHQTYFYGHRIGVIPTSSYNHFNQIPAGADDCSGNAFFGMYADIASGCQGYHVCHGGRKDTFMCPQGTLFNQELLTCDFWYKVNCAAGGSGADAGGTAGGPVEVPTSGDREPIGGSGEGEVDVSVGVHTNTGSREEGEREQPSYSPHFPTFPSGGQPQPQPPSYPTFPTYQPPSYQPPSYQPPSYQPPSYQPPAYQPPSYDPSPYQPPAYEPPSYEPPPFSFNPSPYSPWDGGLGPTNPHTPSGPSGPGGYGPETEYSPPTYYPQPPATQPTYWTEGGVGGVVPSGGGGGAESPWQPEEPEWTYAWMRRFEPTRLKPPVAGGSGGEATITYHSPYTPITKQNFDFILANQDIFSSVVNNNNRRKDSNPPAPGPWLFPVETDIDER